MSEIQYFNITLCCLDEDKHDLESSLLGLGALSITETFLNAQWRVTALTTTPETFLAVFPHASVEEVVGWESKWLAYYDGGDLTESVRVSSSPVEDLEKITIHLDPQGAFGDGRHPTTQLCAKLLETCLPVRSMIDIGTGTGVLAIMAEKCGVGEIDAFDIDPVSVEKAKVNADLNHCESITIYEGNSCTFSSEKTYDVVMANLLTSIIEQSLPSMISLLSRGGSIILSGIGVQWRDHMTTLLHDHNLSIRTILEKDGWLGFLAHQK